MGEVLDHKRAPQWTDEGTYKQPTGTDSARVPRLEIDDATTYIDKDGSNNMTLTDAVTGTKTLAELAAGGISNVVEDLTPQLGGDLDANTHQVVSLPAPDANGEAIRATTKITEVALEDAVDKKHSANADTDLDATFEATFVKHVDVDDAPVDGVTTDPVSSNWAFDHNANASAHHAKYTDAEAVDAVEAAGLILADTKVIEHDPTPAASHTANGEVVTMTGGVAAGLSFGQACYVGTDGKMELALADDAAITIPATHLCIASIAENAAGLFLVKGWAHDDSWAFDVGLSVYLSAATAGLITKTMPVKVTGNQVQVLGTCLVADTIFWNPSMIVCEYA